MRQWTGQDRAAIGPSPPRRAACAAAAPPRPRPRSWSRPGPCSPAAAGPSPLPAHRQAQSQSQSTREGTILAHCMLAFVLNLEAADLELPAVGPARLVRMLPPLLDLREQLVGHKGKHCPLQDNALFRCRRTTKEDYGVTGLENNCRQGIQIALYAGTSE